MEKQRTKSRNQFSRRLLSYLLVLLSFSSLNARTLTAFDFRNLSFSVSSGQDLVTNSEIKFFVNIPYANPSEVEIYSSNETENVSFVSSRRIQSDETNEGTVVEIWYSFSKKGDYQLSPLTLRVQGEFRQIKFDPVSIKFNPKEQFPVIVIKFDDGKVLSSDRESLAQFKKDVQDFSIVAGEKIRFTVFFQYGVQLNSFNWDIPKDSIFVQTRTYDILEKKVTDNVRSEDLIPVSDFEWMPLLPGEIKFPSIRMAIFSFLGYRSEVEFPVFTIKVLEDKEEKIKVDDGLFKEAFMENSVNVEEKKKIEITKEDCEKIAELRIKERHSFIGFAKSRRVKFEQSLDLPANQPEFKIFYVYLALFFVICCIVLFVFFLRKKKAILNIFTILILLSSITLLIGTILNLNKEHAISKGCILYSIPEETAESKSDLMPGSYVQIKEKNGEWIYVHLGETGGWCKKDNFIIIK